MNQKTQFLTFCLQRCCGTLYGPQIGRHRYRRSQLRPPDVRAHGRQTPLTKKCTNCNCSNVAHCASASAGETTNGMPNSRSNSCARARFFMVAANELTLLSATSSSVTFAATFSCDDCPAFSSRISRSAFSYGEIVQTQLTISWPTTPVPTVGVQAANCVFKLGDTSLLIGRLQGLRCIVRFCIT